MIYLNPIYGKNVPNHQPVDVTIVNEVYKPRISALPAGHSAQLRGTKFTCQWWHSQGANLDKNYPRGKEPTKIHLWGAHIVPLIHSNWHHVFFGLTHRELLFFAFFTIVDPVSHHMPKWPKPASHHQSRLGKLGLNQSYGLVDGKWCRKACCEKKQYPQTLGV